MLPVWRFTASVRRLVFSLWFSCREQQPRSYPSTQRLMIGGLREYWAEGRSGAVVGWWLPQRRTGSLFNGSPSGEARQWSIVGWFPDDYLCLFSVRYCAGVLGDD